jgi:hypothetical protein
MSSPLWNLQTALYNRLSGEISVTSNRGAVVVPVLDEVLNGQEFPYITLGSETAMDNSDLVRRGDEITYTLDIWSTYRGRKEIIDIIDQIDTLLSDGRGALDLGAGWQCAVMTPAEFAEIVSDPDPTIRHGVVRYRFYVERV